MIHISARQAKDMDKSYVEEGEYYTSLLENNGDDSDFVLPLDADGEPINRGDAMDWNGVRGVCVGYDHDSGDACRILFKNDDLGDIDCPKAIALRHVRG